MAEGNLSTRFPLYPPPSAWALVLAIVVLPILAGCASGPRVARIEIEEYAFAPAEVTVAMGTTVKFTNHDPAPHTVTPKDPALWGSQGSELLGKGDSWSFIFTEPGRYEYFCRPHAFMVGVVIVTSDSPATNETNSDSPSTPATT